jgi:hypothetical protein
MPVVGMELFQFALKSINVRGGEFVGRDGWPSRPFPDASARRPYLAKPTHNVQHVQRPAALGDGNVFQRLHALEFFPHFARRHHCAFGDDGDAGFGRDAVQIYIAAHPTSAARGRRKRRAFDDG